MPKATVISHELVPHDGQDQDDAEYAETFPTYRFRGKVGRLPFVALVSLDGNREYDEIPEKYEEDDEIIQIAIGEYIEKTPELAAHEEWER